MCLERGCSQEELIHKGKYADEQQAKARVQAAETIKGARSFVLIAVDAEGGEVVSGLRNDDIESVMKMMGDFSRKLLVAALKVDEMMDKEMQEG